MTDNIADIARGLEPLEREFITGWQGVGGAAYNVIATGLVGRRLLNGPLDWRLSPLGMQVRAHLENKDG